VPESSAGYFLPPEVEAAVAELDLADEWYGNDHIGGSVPRDVGDVM
jgi:hypothetical protein